MLKQQNKSQSRTPRKITEKSLRNIALYYLQRYSSSGENLKRILMRRIWKSASAHEIDMDEAASWVEVLVETLTKSGFIDDKLYAEGQVRTLFRRGTSPNSIAQRLRQKGVDADLINQVLAELRNETSDPDLQAAVRLAKRRRFGPFRLSEMREQRRDKDLAALARAGFDYATAHKVVDAETIEELEGLLITDPNNL